MENMEKNNCAEIIEENVQSFGLRLTEFIEKIGMNKKRLADEISMSPQTISNYCSGMSQPKPRFLEILVQRFGANRDWLMTGNGPMFSTRQESRQPSGERTPLPHDEQLVDLKHRLAEQILAGIEERDRHSKWFTRAMEAIAKTAQTYGLTKEQHRAVMDAVIDPEKAMAALEAVESRQAAVGEE